MNVDHGTGIDHALERLVFFSDAVFAIAITLLVLEVERPELGFGSTNADWMRELGRLVPSFAAFLLSFFVIGSMWVNHHTVFTYVRRYEERLLWPNLLLLLSVAVLPFTTSLMATGSVASVPFAIYAGSLLATGLLKARLVSLALTPRLTDPSVPNAALAYERRRSWILPIAAGVTLLLAFVVPPFNTFAMLLVPILAASPYFRKPGNRPVEQETVATPAD